MRVIKQIVVRILVIAVLMVLVFAGVTLGSIIRIFLKGLL